MSGLGASNVTRGWQFLDEKTRFSGHDMLFSWIPRRLSCPWYCCCLVGQRWTSAEHVALSISVCLFSPFYSALSQSVFVGTIQRRLACPCASVDTHQLRSVVKFHVAQFQRCDASFLPVSSQGKVFVHSCSQLRTCLADH